MRYGIKLITTAAIAMTQGAATYLTIVTAGFVAWMSGGSVTRYSRPWGPLMKGVRSRQCRAYRSHADRSSTTTTAAGSSHIRHLSAQCSRAVALAAIGMCVLHATSAQAAISVGDTGTAAFVSNTTISITNQNTAADDVLVVGFATNATSDTTTGCTHNGDAMTLVESGNNGDLPTGFNHLYILVSPDVGTGLTITCTVSASTGLEAISVAYAGAKLTGQPDSEAEDTATVTTSLTVSTTVVASNAWLVGFFRAGSDFPVAGTGATQRVTAVDLATRLFDSNGTVGTGSQSMQVTRASNDYFHGILMSLAPTASAAASRPCCLGVF